MSEEVIGTVAEEAPVEGAVAPAAEPAAEPATSAAADDGLGDISDAELLARVQELVPDAEPAPAVAPAAPPATPVAPAAEPPKPAGPSVEEMVARQVAEHRAREESKAATARMEARMAELEQRLSVYEGDSVDPAAILDNLQKRGVDLETLTGAALGEKNPDRLLLRRALTALDRIEAERKADAAAAAKRAQDEQYQANIRDYVSKKVAAPLSAKKAEFPYLYAIHGDEGVPNLVYGHLDAVFRERGQELAAVDVARDLEAKAKQRYQEIRAKVEPAPTASKPAATTPKPKPKTLNNSLTQTTPPDDPDNIDDDYLEQKARAHIAAMS